MTTVDTGALSQLWEADVLGGGHGQTSPPSTFLVLPSVEHPRLVVPTRPHRAAGVILNALRDKSSFSARARTVAARLALASGVRAVRLPDPEILAVAIEQLPDAEYVYGVHLGPPRANRKPVLVLATTHGDLVAFVKCGIDPLTDRLVRNEAAALGSVADLTSVRVPRLLGIGEHQSHPYVIQSPVPTEGPSFGDAAAVVAAQVEVASVSLGLIGQESALDAVAQQWRQRVAAAGQAHKDVVAFAELAKLWVEHASDNSLQWGSWHGDWRHTNMSVTTSGCSVWDWERFATGIPLGYDALHLFLMSHAASVRDLHALPVDLFDNAARLLRPFGVRERAVAELTTAGYLLELAGRYLDDNQSQAGARLGSVGEWLLPYLSTQLAQRGSRHLGRGVGEL
ncbi:MAG: hypothetical protein LH645_00090 [Actinomycetia bacterium]|nr:hypothetical protein [Actinomycetes bacterium]